MGETARMLNLFTVKLTGLSMVYPRGRWIASNDDPPPNRREALCHETSSLRKVCTRLGCSCQTKQRWYNRERRSLLTTTKARAYRTAAIPRMVPAASH
jgi:hypothetical protein